MTAAIFLEQVEERVKLGDDCDGEIPKMATMLRLALSTLEKLQRGGKGQYRHICYAGGSVSVLDFWSDEQYLPCRFAADCDLTKKARKFLPKCCGKSQGSQDSLGSTENTARTALAEIDRIAKEGV